MADVLGLLAATVALQGNSDSAVTSPPGGNASAVTALQNMLTHRAGYYPWLFSVTAVGAVGDGQMVTDGAVSAGRPTAPACATSAPFTPGDVGQAVVVNGAPGTGSAGVFASTGANSTNQGTFQNACVIGTSPNFATLNANILGFPAFENIHVIFENWTIVTPSSANGINYTAFSLAGSAKGEFWNCAALVTTNYNNSSGSNAFPATGTLANGTSTGFILPGNGNNDCCILDNCISSGYAYGRQLAEHAVVKGGANIGCWASFKLMGNDGAGGGHLIKTMAASTELCTSGFYVCGSGTTGFTIDADIDVEGISNNSMLLNNNPGGGRGSLLGETGV